MVDKWESILVAENMAELAYILDYAYKSELVLWADNCRVDSLEEGRRCDTSSKDSDTVLYCWKPEEYRVSDKNLIHYATKIYKPRPKRSASPATISGPRSFPMHCCCSCLRKISP